MTDPGEFGDNENAATFCFRIRLRFSLNETGINHEFKVLDDFDWSVFKASAESRQRLPSRLRLDQHEQLSNSIQVALHMR